MRKMLIVTVLVISLLIVTSAMAAVNPHVGGYRFIGNPHVGGYSFVYPHVGGYRFIGHPHVGGY